MDVDTAVRRVEAEYIRGGTLPKINSPYEGYAILLGEMDALWAHIKQYPRSDAALRKRAIQVAAMAIRFLVDCC